MPTGLKELDHMVRFDLNLMAIEKINNQYVTGEIRTLRYLFMNRNSINNLKLIVMLNGRGHHKEDCIQF